MKNIINKSLIVCLSLFLLSCEKTEDVVYEGVSQLQFSKTDAATQTVESGTVSSQAVIEYGTLSPVSGTHQVQLVYDAAKSTAVPGVDFTLADGGVSTLNAGQVIGNFKVNVLESGATPVPKVAVFHLSSATLPLAQFAQDFTLTMSLRCSLSSFLGNGVFNNNPGWFNAPNGSTNGGQWQIIADPVNPKTLRVVDWLDIGKDLIVKYNDAGVATFEEQDSGVPYQGGPNNFTIKQSTAGAVSTYDACSRVLTLKAFWFIPNVGSFGEKTETFVGT